MVIIPMCILAILAMIFEEEVDDTLNETAIEIITCPLPDFQNGYNATEITCAVVNHPDTYADDQYILWNFTVNGGFFSGGANVDWVAGIPTGIGNWIIHTAVTVIAKYGAFQLLVIGILGLNVFLIVLIEAPILLIPYLMLYIVLGIGLYKTLLPFVGR